MGGQNMPAERPKKHGILGSMKGSVLKYERPFDPIPGEWTGPCA
jgi:hypothetical protein